MNMDLESNSEVDHADAMDKMRAEVARLRSALETIRDSRQLGRLGFVEPIEVYIPRIKEIARAALQKL